MWTLFTDGASSIEGSGAGLILTDPNGQEVTYALRFDFKTSNNEAEYEALIARLDHIIPGVYYAPEVTLNILSLELLEKQGFQVNYDGNRCSLTLMFKDKEIKRFDEDRLRRMQNHYLQKYFESTTKEGEGLEQDIVRIKGNLYTTKVQSFNDFVAFLNLVKLDDVVSQEWDYFRQRFNMVVKWFFNHYLNRSLPGTIPPVINGVEIHLFDLYKIMENLGGYLSVHFSQEFDMVGEIMGLSKGNGEEIRRCYMNFLEIHQLHTL
ncbi:ARID DNA-binding domain-containing protein [Tanacetum coccineum]